MSNRLPDDTDSRHDPKRTWTPEEIAESHRKTNLRFREELYGEEWRVTVSTVREEWHAEAGKKGADRDSYVEQQLREWDCETLEAYAAQRENERQMRLLESESGEGRAYLESPECSDQERDRWLDIVRANWRNERDGKRAYAARRSEIRRGRIVPYSREYIDQMRADGSGLWDADDGVCWAGYYHRDDAIAERYVHEVGVPRELGMARDVVRAAIAAARRLEDEFLRVGPRVISLNPAEDVGTALSFVQYAHKGLTENASKKTSTGIRSPLRDGFLPLGSSDPVGTYAALSEAKKREWRIAFMRWLDQCDDNELSHDALAFTRKASRGEVPIPIGDFDRDDLRKVLIPWRFTTAGAPERDSDRSRDGKGGKYEAVRALLAKVWGCTVTWQMLRDEYSFSKTSAGVELSDSWPTHT